MASMSYYYHDRDPLAPTKGPMGISQLQSLYSNKKINGNTFIWDGKYITKWTALKGIPELHKYVKQNDKQKRSKSLKKTLRGFAGLFDAKLIKNNKFHKDDNDNNNDNKRNTKKNDYIVKNDSNNVVDVSIYTIYECENEDEMECEAESMEWSESSESISKLKIT